MDKQTIINYVTKTPLNTNKAILASMLDDLESNGDGIVRRDNDYNYDKIADTFIPSNGEICLVDTSKDGLRVKVGDGKTVWRELEYADEFVVKGYYNEGKFYKDNLFTKPINGAVQKLYIDLKTHKIYFYENDTFLTPTVGVTIDDIATSDRPGVVKLYDELGEAEDGTLSQKALTEELAEKVEVSLNKSEELLIFT